MSIIEELGLTEQDLNKEFQIQRARSIFISSEDVYSDSETIWQTPTRFTIRWAIDNGYSKSKILKLKQCHVGDRVLLAGSNQVQNRLFARPIDAVDSEIKAKEIVLEEISLEIKRIAGSLMKEQTKLRKEIKLIKQNNQR